MEITLKKDEARALYRFHSYRKYRIENKMTCFFYAHNIDVEDILLNIRCQFLDSFAEYKRKRIPDKNYMFIFNDDECKRLLKLTNTVTYEFLEGVLDDNFKNRYIENLFNGFKSIHKELSSTSQANKEMKLFRYFREYCYGDCTEEILVYAESKEIAISKIIKQKEKNNESTEYVLEKYFSEVLFDDSGTECI